MIYAGVYQETTQETKPTVHTCTGHIEGFTCHWALQGRQIIAGHLFVGRPLSTVNNLNKVSILSLSARFTPILAANTPENTKHPADKQHVTDVDDRSDVLVIVRDSR